MSHDIRTPMNVIMGFTNIALQHADDSDKMKECLEKIRVSGSNLQELIDDVLDISRIESEEFKIVSQPVKLPELCDFYCQASAGMAEAKNIRFSGKPHDISHNVLLSDQIRLGLIYMNLLSNAVKYTPEIGDVKFEAYEEKLAESGKVRLVSVVSDKGIGMTPEFMEQMYSAFSRAVDTRVNKVRGSGLGLAMVYGIVRQTEGFIKVNSILGKGTTFSIHLPRFDSNADEDEIPDQDAKEPITAKDGTPVLTVREKRTSPVAVNQKLIFGLNVSAIDRGQNTGPQDENIRILFVEDEDSVRTFAMRALKKKGYEVIGCNSAENALEQLEKDTAFNLLITDMVMPGMSGAELAGIVRRKIPAIKIILASGYSEEIARRELASSQDFEFMAKPFSLGDLTKKVFDVLNQE